ncbi:MAG: fimbrial protein [Rhizobiaceae bacterium]
MTGQPQFNRAPAADDEDKPLDPAVERVRRKMMRLMAVSVGIMMVGLMAVLLAIVYKVSVRSDAAGGKGDYFETVLALPEDGRIVSQSLSGERLSLLVEHGAGRQTIFVFDTATRKLAARIEVGAK